MPTYSNIRGADADQNLAVSNTAVGLTLPAYATQTGASPMRARCQVRTAAVLFTTNQTDPTAANEATAQKANVGDFVTAYGVQEIKDISFIRATGTDGALFIIYERRVD